MNQRVEPQGCVLKATEVKGRLQGLLGEITISQTYENTEQVNIEAVFTFPIPSEAVLLGVEIRINERVLQGQILPKRQAEEAYEDAVSGGDSAILLQEAGRGLYTVNVGNLLPGETARLTYRYALLYVWNGEILRFHLPTAIAPRYGNPSAAGLQSHQVPEVALDAVNSFSLDVELGGALRLAEVESPSHRIRVQTTPDGLRVRLTGAQAHMDRDFILNIRGPNTARVASGVFAPDREGYVALASFQPDLPVTSTSGRDMVLVADCSGSMAGDSIAQTREALLAILDRLHAEDRFNLIAFGNQAQTFFPSLAPADASRSAQARQWIAALDANMGGTEIGAALQLAYRQGQGQPLDILLITDGEVWEVERLIGAAVASGCRLFTVGVGAAVAEGLVRGLADATGGACELVHPNEEMTARIVRHFERIRAPRAAATVTWPVAPIRQWPEQVQRVFSGDTLHIIAWLPTRPEAAALLELALADERRLNQPVTLESWPIAETADTLARLATARRIATLPAEEATQLAVEYQLVTPHTHFLMVDVRAEGEKAADLPALRTVPHMLAAGWGGIGQVMAAPCAAPMETTGEYLAIPAFLRRQADAPAAPVRRMKTTVNVMLDKIKTFLQPTPVQMADGPRSFAAWLDVNSAAFSDKAKLWPTLDDLERAGVPPALIAQLRGLVAGGETEEAVVAALLYGFIKSCSSCRLPRSASRAIRARFQRQVSKSLAATVEPLVTNWCTAD